MKRWLQYLLHGFSFLLFGLILWWGGPEAWQQILTSHWPAVLVAFLLHGGAGMISALRLQIVANALAQRPLATWPRFYYLNMTARALGLIAPRGLSTLGGKSVGLRAFGVPIRHSVWMVMVDNLFDLLLLGVLTLPSLLFLQAGMSVWIFWGWCVLLIGGVTAVFWWATHHQHILWQRLGRIPWLAQRLNLDEESPLLPPPQSIVVVAFLTVLLSLAIATSFYAIGQAIDVPATWMLFIAIFPITQLSLIVAIAPGGLGIFDLGWLGLLRLGGISETDALAFVIAQRAYVFMFVLIWAGVSALLSLTAAKDNPDAKDIQAN